MKKRFALGAAIAAATAAAWMGASTAPVFAQAAGTVTTQQAIHDLKADYGIVIIPSNGIDMNMSVNRSVVEIGSATPTQAVDTLAGNIHAQAQKIFIVEPASAAHPATTLADARQFQNTGGRVTLELVGVPASDAIKAVASAADAKVDLRADVGRQTVDETGNDMNVAQAIAQVAAQTNTHWVEAYALSPRPQTEMARASYHRIYPLVTMNVGQSPTGPVTIHLPPPPAQNAAPAQPAPAAGADASTAIANSNPTVNSAQATPTEPVNPYAASPYGYSPYYMIQNGYAYTPYGVPYRQSWSGWYGGGYPSGSGTYYQPDYGYGYSNPPMIISGTTTTAGF